MSVASFLQAVYELAELLIGEGLSDQARHLIRGYFDDAGNLGLSERALYAVSRYTNAELPSLDSVLRKARGSDLSRIEALIRRIHDEALQLREEYNR
ncbi:MAG: hypothetical protein JSV89_06160 [Spirochaetaceae bacterium]|nr:MAG: hypothetical protein JSV89_06160 [Spirochaetaceae bacterium]